VIKTIEVQPPTLIPDEESASIEINSPEKSNKKISLTVKDDSLDTKSILKH
jgi:hypothetical protein